MQQDTRKHIVDSMHLHIKEHIVETILDSLQETIQDNMHKDIQEHIQETIQDSLQETILVYILKTI